MSKSVIQTAKRCYITGETENLHKHHLLNGVALRDFSEKNGLWVYLTEGIHENLHTNWGVEIPGYPSGQALAKELKRVAQYYFEKTHTRDEWMEVVHKNYLVTPLSEEEKDRYHISEIKTEGYDCKEDILEYLKEKLWKNTSQKINS